MDAESAKLLGAGLAAVGAGLASLGVGNVFAKFLEGALRNPGAADGQQGRLFIGFAAAELLGLLSFVVAMILIFVAEGTRSSLIVEMLAGVRPGRLTPGHPRCLRLNSLPPPIPARSSGCWCSSASSSS